MMFYCHGFVMVHHGSSWFASWFVMFLCHGFVMVRDVLLSWFHHGLSWFVMFYCHAFVMVHHGSSWFT